MILLIIIFLITLVSIVLSIYNLIIIHNNKKSCPSNNNNKKSCPSNTNNKKSCPSNTNNKKSCSLIPITKCPTSSKTFKLIRNWNGTDLIPQNNKGWQYIIGSDPTHGLVNYTAGTLDNSFKNSTKDNLSIQLVNNPGHFISSIRLNTVEAFDYGLFVFDVKQIPYGQFIWPAIWLNGMISGTDSWPANGEIDVIEGGWQIGGGQNAQNTVSFHTDPGCKSNSLNLNDSTGNCNLCGDGNTSCTDVPNHRTCGKNTKNLCAFMGCSKLWPPMSSNAYGKAFKDSGGGIYAVNLTCNGKIKLWFISAQETNYSSIKNSSNLTPDKLDALCKPENILDAKTSGCSNSFRNLQITINTTICGDAFTGGSRDKCNPDILYQNMNNPEFIKNSKWLINSIKVYQ